MNKVFLIGRLTRDPELRYTNNQVASTTFSIAVNRTYANQNGEREADFINIVVWRKQAETVKQYLTKGSQVAIDGRIQTRSYDAQDGTKRYVTEVVADNVQFLDTKASRENNFNPSPAQPAFNDNATPYDFSIQPNMSMSGSNISADPFKDFGSNIEIGDDDLPF